MSGNKTIVRGQLVSVQLPRLSLFSCFLSSHLPRHRAQVEYSWYRYGVDTVWSIVNSVGHFFASMWSGADAVRPRDQAALSSRDYRGGRSGMSNVKSVSQMGKNMPPAS